jgi:hypothetical protein
MTFQAFDSDKLRGLLASLGLDGKLSVEELLDAGVMGQRDLHNSYVMGSIEVC